MESWNVASRSKFTAATNPPEESCSCPGRVRVYSSLADSYGRRNTFLLR